MGKTNAGNKLFRAAWIILIVYGGNLASALATGSLGRDDAVGWIHLGVLFLGFPFAGFALFYVAARGLTRLTGRPGGRYLGAGLLAALGLFLTGVGVYELVEGLRSSGFPTVQGTILSSSTRTETDTSRDSDSKRTRTSTTYYFDVRYEYRVGGKDYQGKEYDVSSGSLDRELAYALPDQFPAGSSATVYYDPGRPATAYLKPGPAGTWFFLVPIGLFLAALGGGALGWFERERASRAASRPSSSHPHS